MSILRRGVYVVLVALAGGTIFLWQDALLPCRQPIQYSLGIFDTRFGITEGVFLKEAEAAEKLWEDTLGKNLFEYVPGANFKINLVFDERQERTLEAKRLEASFEQAQSTQETLEENQRKVLALYETTRQDYERMLASFKKRLAAYNAEVEKWNSRGGAPKDEYEDLEDVSALLVKNEEELETKRQEVNRLATQVNAFSREQIAVVEGHNEQVEKYVNRYGEATVFDQGDYVDQEINIYQYEDTPHLRAVLVHEFGHALGLGHGTDSTSIMFHLMGAQSLDPLRLSAEDGSMLLRQCNRTVFDIMKESLIDLKERILTDDRNI